MATIVKRVGKRGVRWQVKTKDATGKQASAGTYATEEEAKDRAAELRQFERNGGAATIARAGGWTFDQWADECLTQWRVIGGSSRNSYRRVIELHLVPFFGSAPLHKIDKRLVERWVSSQDCAPASLRVRFTVLRRILKHAVRNSLLAASPTDGVELPRITKKKTPRTYLTVEQVEVLADAIDIELRAFVYLGAYCGLRPGELYALRWSDLDLEHCDLDGAHNPLVRVERTITIGEHDGKRVEGAGAKTAASEAAVPIPTGHVLDELLLHQARTGGHGEDRVFAPERGDFWRSSNFARNVWTPTLARARQLAKARHVRALPASVTPHTMRHTAVALWIKSGADAKEVSTRARHSSVAFTLDTYGGLFPDRGRQVDRALDALIGAARS